MAAFIGLFAGAVAAEGDHVLTIFDNDRILANKPIAQGFSELLTIFGKVFFQAKPGFTGFWCPSLLEETTPGFDLFEEDMLALPDLLGGAWVDFIDAAFKDRLWHERGNADPSEISEKCRRIISWQTRESGFLRSITWHCYKSGKDTVSFRPVELE